MGAYCGGVQQPSKQREAGLWRVRELRRLKPAGEAVGALSGVSKVV